jgi:hypothetical protein
MIQTPAGAGKINLLANEVEITLGSSAYLQAGEGEMTVSIIEGEGTVSAFDTTVNLPAGTRSRIPLDENGLASGPPAAAEPYIAADLSALPTVLLPEAITVATPLTQDEIDAMSQDFYVGNWTINTVNECDVLVGTPASYTTEYIQGTQRGAWGSARRNDEYNLLGDTASSAILSFLEDLETDNAIIIPGQYSEYSEDDENTSSIVVNIESSTSITATLTYTVPGVECTSTITMQPAD